MLPGKFPNAEPVGCGMGLIVAMALDQCVKDGLMTGHEAADLLMGRDRCPPSEPLEPSYCWQARDQRKWDPYCWKPTTCSRCRRCVDHCWCGQPY